MLHVAFAYHLKGLLVSVLGWLAIIFPMSHVVAVVALGDIGSVAVPEMAWFSMVGGERHRLAGTKSSWLCRLSIFSSVT